MVTLTMIRYRARVRAFFACACARYRSIIVACASHAALRHNCLVRLLGIACRAIDADNIPKAGVCRLSGIG